MQQRHARYQDTPYALEPNCKESPGGLRDLQVILWMARAAGFGDNWRQVAQAGLLTPSEARDLRKAEQAFKRLRIELHLLARRREDRVLFDLQPALAEIYRIHATATRRGSELLMQRYYWAARLVTQLNVILVQNIEERLFPRPTATRATSTTISATCATGWTSSVTTVSSAIRPCCCAPSSSCSNIPS